MSKWTFPILAAALATAPLAAPAAPGRAQQTYDQAVARVDRFVDHFRRTSDRRTLLGELQLAADELQQCAALAGQENDPALAARAQVKLADVLRYQDQWDQSIRVYQQAAGAAGAANATAVEIRALLGHARALLYGKQAPGPARPLVARALTRVPHADDRTLEFDALDLLGQLQVIEGDLAGAADSYNRAFRLEGVIEDDKLLFYGFLDRGDVYQKFAEKGDYARDVQPCLDAVKLARRDYQSALAAAERLGWAGLAGQVKGCLNRLAVREEMIRSQQRVRDALTAAGVFAPQKPDDVLVKREFAAGANPELAGLFERIEAAGGLPLADDARGAYVRGQLDEVAGNRDAALGWYLRAVDLLEVDRRKLHDERGRGSFIEDKVSIYYTAIGHLLDRREHAKAFELMERSRSRVMSDLIATRELALPTAGERALYARLLELDAEIARRQSALFELAASPATAADAPALAMRGAPGNAPDRGLKPITPDDDDPGPLRAAIEQLQQQRGRIRDQMFAEAPRLGQLVTTQPCTLDALRQTLAADGSELLTYLCLDHQLLLWHIKPDSVEVLSVFLPRSELAAKIERLRASLTSPAKPFDTRTAHELYLFLVSPVADRITAPHLVVVPHGDLHYLPFQTLSIDGRDRFLGDEFQLSYAPSTSLLVAMAPPQPLAAAKVLAVADPGLANAPREVLALGRHHQGRLHTAQLPTEAEVRSWMPDQELVHFAVHGSFIADEPLLSCLHLRADGDDDGRLTAAEMYGLPLDSARLVVLSACETGIVRATHANEVLGILRGLMFAGAESLLLSAWKIDDQATADWMEAFYAAAKSQPPAAAAHAAIRALRANPDHRHPFYWSPFLVVGR